MDDTIISISFSGFTTVDAKFVNFNKAAENDENSHLPNVIDGTQWLQLDESQQAEYVLQSLSDVLEYSNPAYEQIDCEAGDIG